MKTNTPIPRSKRVDFPSALQQLSQLLINLPRIQKAGEKFYTEHELALTELYQRIHEVFRSFDGVLVEYHHLVGWLVEHLIK